MILYKTLPPLIIDIDSPERMTVSKEAKNFKYSDIVSSKKPIQLRIEIKFNDSIINSNNINKEIVRTVYDSLKLSFVEQGKFRLYGVENNILNESIDGEVFFTNENGVIEGEMNGKEIKRTLHDTIQGGVLSRKDIYIDAIFNQEGKKLLIGNYSGTVSLDIEFMGKETTSR